MWSQSTPHKLHLKCLSKNMPRFFFVRIVQVLTVKHHARSTLQSSVEPEVERALLVACGHQFVTGLEKDPDISVKIGAVGQSHAQGVLDGVVIDCAIALEAKVRAVNLVAPSHVDIHPQVFAPPTSHVHEAFDVNLFKSNGRRPRELKVVGL